MKQSTLLVILLSIMFSVMCSDADLPLSAKNLCKGLCQREITGSSKEIPSPQLLALSLARYEGVVPYVSLVGHCSWVRSVACSPDGKIVASASLDETVCFWDREKRQQIMVLQHNSSVNSVQFLSGGKLLATGTANETVRLWDVERQQQTYECAGSRVKVSSDDKIIACALRKYIKLLDMKSGKQIALLPGHKDCVLSLSFSPDGRLLASGSSDYSMRLWDINQRQQFFALEDDSSIDSVAFAPCGRVLAYGDYCRIRMLDVDRYEQIGLLSGHKGVDSIIFSPDGKTLACASFYDNTIRLWDRNRQRQIIALPDTSYVSSVAYSPDGSTLISGSWDNTVKLWHLL